ncbi:UspA domain-containing protein [Methanobacterium lacus]|uniref:UspA domain-containing protein n=1 Tax=Methanobacterium lacus (strain AL-21) TaxID=877455 RepID=F0TCG6_METLA|nr:universal stress protein [Methanobacterium lacus]ADZ09243.1 UspA domain-containing protein [Methanobacterium lacus]
MFERIMFPTDGSEYAARSEDIVMEMAKKFGSTVVAVNIIDDKLIYPFEVLEDEGKSILSHVSERGQNEDVKVEEVLIVGSPTHDMEKIVKKTEADLVVIATHGKTGLEKLILGSVAESALKTVKVPVLLVKKT